MPALQRLGVMACVARIINGARGVACGVTAATSAWPAPSCKPSRIQRNVLARRSISRNPTLMA